MKKALLIALFGLMFVGLASFTNGTQPEATSENGTSISKPVNDSKEFTALKAFIKKYENLFKNAKSCEEMEEILEQMDKESEKFPVYEEKDRMTEKEEGILEEMSYDFFMVVQQKALEFGCE